MHQVDVEGQEFNLLDMQKSVCVWRGGHRGAFALEGGVGGFHFFPHMSL